MYFIVIERCIFSQSITFESRINKNCRNEVNALLKQLNPMAIQSLTGGFIRIGLTRYKTIPGEVLKRVLVVHVKIILMWLFQNSGINRRTRRSLGLLLNIGKHPAKLFEFRIQHKIFR